MSPRDAYHHGDLRNALIRAAGALAERGGPDAVTIRAAAREVGVTPTAAYRHFTGHDELLDAAKEQCMALLTAAMRKRLDALPVVDDPIEATIARLEALGRGYIDFALAEPGLFRTCFGRGKQMTATGVSEAELRAQMATPDSPHTLLVDQVGELIATGFLTEEQRIGAEMCSWSMVHGLSMLLIDGPLAALSEVERQAIVEATITGFTEAFWRAGTR